MNEGGRVLVAGDGDAAATASARLGENEFDVVEAATDDAEAWGRAAEFDCLVCAHDDRDLVLERLRDVRADDDDFPVVVYTDGGDEALASAAVTAGVTEYLRHDADGDALADRVAAAVETYRRERDLLGTAARYRSLVEQNLVGIYVVRDYAFEYVNPRFAELFGYDQSELCGMDVAELVDPADRDRVLGNLRQRLDGNVEGLQYGFTARTKSGEPLEIEVHGTRVESPDGGTVVMGTLIDRTRERRRSDALDALYGAAEELSRAVGREEICTVSVESAAAVLGLSATTIHLRDDGRLVPVAATDGAGDVVDDVPTVKDGDATWERYADGSVVVERDGVEFLPRNSGALVAPLGDHGLFAAVTDDATFDGERVELFGLLAANVAAALDRAEREMRASRLHEATRRLMSARDETTVAEVGTETAREVLGLSVCAVYVLDENDDALVPAAWTDGAVDLFGEIPTLRADESLAWRAFESGEAIVEDDVRARSGLYNPDTNIRSELILPLGDHGIFMAGGVRRAAFDEGQVSVAKVLAANVEAALDRADREQELREREAEFRRQSERLGEFASVVSHDLRNPLSVAQGHLEIVREETDSAHVDAIENAHDRMRALIDDLLTLARQGEAVGETSAADLRLLVMEAWVAVDGGTLDVPDDLGTLDCDGDRVRELLVNLFSNAVEHAGSDVTVTVGRLDGGGFFVADDGPGIDPDRREAVFERGETTDEHGTGFGLAIVRSIAEAHGWPVSVAESESGGARFEIRTADAQRR
jgi:PAS domain S-box-containing protein